MHLPILPLSLFALLPTLASSVIVYQTSTLTVPAAAATSYVTAASSLAPSAAPSSAPSATTSSSPAAAAPSSSNSQYTSDTTFESSIINSTNTYRHLYNATSLTWNTTLASYASTYADKCIFAHSHGPYGENIAETYPNVTAAVEGWGGEGKKYDWGSPGFGEGTGHFTQLVWKRTTSVGCGRVDCDGNAVKGNATGWLVVCEYWPTGNVEGEYSQEVNKEIVKCLANGGGEAGKVAQALCAKINGAERSGRVLRVWSWEAVLVAGAWMLVRAAL